MKTYKITGGGGIQLHVVETGNPKGNPILVIHGLSQCWLTWSRQLNSELAEDCRLVAMDMRGHGLSDKPREGYADSALWANDVNAVIRGLGLDHPLLCGWSYGPLVILDYVRHYGEDGISGLNLSAELPNLVATRRSRCSLLSFSASYRVSLPTTWKSVYAVLNRYCDSASHKGSRLRNCT
jgi:non-heme chloroperoxidase